jgi:uncharacterized membrane protein
MQKNSVARGVLMSAMIIVFGVFGLDKFLHPLSWIGWMPLWMDGLLGINKSQWLMVTGVIELIFAAALLFPSRIVRRIAAYGMALHLAFILTQTGMNDLFVRDLGLMLSAVALALLL